MFCPRCGKAEQQTNAYCRNCGAFLPNFDAFKNKVTAPKTHFAANISLSAMTAVVSLAFVIALHITFTGRDGTPILIYLTTGFLTAIFFWQAQVLWRTLLLRKQFPGLNRENENQTIKKTSFLEPAGTRELLNETDLSDTASSRIGATTTKKFGAKMRRK